MATRSRPPSRARSPVDQGQLEPLFPPASPELGEVSLERVIRLLWGLQAQVCTNVENISQAVDVVKDGLAQLQHTRGPHTPEDQKPPAVEETPRAAPKAEPLGKAQPFLGGPAPIISTGAPRRDPLSLFNPYPSSSFPLGRLQPPRDLHQRLQFPSDLEVLSFLLMNMEEAAGAWAHPHLDQLGSHRALIQTVDEFKTEFLAAFGDPDATRAAERKITSLTQTGTCAEYITKFRTLQMELDWNDAALCGQFARGLHWEGTARRILIIDNALREERASHPQQGNKSGKSSTTPNRGASTGQQATKTGPLSSNPNYVSEEERNRRRAEGLCVKCGRAGHKFAECRTGWKATPKEDKGKAKETAKIGEDSEYQLGKETAETIEALIDSGATSSFLHPRTAESLRIPLIDLPTPRTVTMLDGTSPQAGKIWKKANLTFSFDGKPIAKEEEADQNPLEGVPSKYHQYAKVFGEEEFNKLPPHRHYDIGIELTEEGPLNSPLYSMTDAESATLKDWLRDELKAGKIRPSKSSISSPVMFVPKKDGSRRLVVDYRRLNNRTKKNVYPLPRPDDLMAQLRGAKVFTKLDLRWGYNNVRVKEGDEWKTAFRTKYGLYKSLVMTFGLTNAPASFQHFMNELFKDLLDVCVIIYLDDILIYSKDDATHTQHVHEVLRRLMENQLFCKASKCTFHVTSVEYLGIIVSDKGFSLDKLKIQAVQEWPTPTKVKEVQSFLGFANFLRRFVANFSHMARPLHNLVKKDTTWNWGPKEQEAFQGLKDAITNAPVLCHADPDKPYFLETDASGAALGSILSQRQEDGRLHPLGFLSESFKGAEQNYDTHDKELLAIIRSFEYWRVKNLQPPPRTMAPSTSRIQFQIVYRPGKQSGKPDALSRRSDHADIPPEPQSMLPKPVFANIALVLPEKELQKRIESSLDQDESLEEILRFLENESKAPPSIKKAFKDYQMEAGLLFYQGRIVVPDTTDPGIGLPQLLLARHPADTYWHVDTCETCQRIRKPKYASIPPQPLELPVRPWQHVSYDMIVDLPKDGGNDSILVIVDSFTKYGIFVKCSKKLKAPELAELFLEHVWKRHGMPEKTVSDRGRILTSLQLITPKQRSNGTVNPSIEHFLRAYSGVNQRDWTKWLPMAEFAYNNAVHSSTGKTPFKALYGWEPTLTPRIRESLEFEIGEEAWLDAKNVNLKTLSPKLTEQRLGPFKVIEKISNRAYRLELPPTMRIHNVFYVGLLSKVKRDDKRAFENRPPPVTVDGEEEYEVKG
ncbi:hypothetical protein RHS01_08304 [Rhizoctonia solani]|uniref:Retrotransposable element Tf2 155 kDa protein type 1 n=1 Tax=Rhizoctonia solani TaxID=456999 RepID=A0A8H7I5F1_9AGAM|nr:hypothetical protein RHS01_08304 [Rhizoctonia solani]